MSKNENTFTHDGYVYDLDKVRYYLRNSKMFLLDIDDLVWVLNFDFPEEERVRLAQHRHPLIVTRWNDKWVVVDGLHRLEKYRRKGIKKIPVKEISKEYLSKSISKDRN